MSAEPRTPIDFWSDEVLLRAAGNRLDVAWQLLTDFYNRVQFNTGNAFDISRLRDLLRRVMDAKLETDVLRIRAENRADSPPPVRSGVDDAA